MTTPIVLKFDDFKKLAKDDKRIYYYNGSNYFDFSFISDGVIVKSSILKSEIDDEQRFFSDKMFYGAMELKFPIPNPKTDWTSVDGIKAMLNEPLVIQDFQDEETKNEDIQKESIIYGTTDM